MSSGAQQSTPNTCQKKMWPTYLGIAYTPLRFLEGECVAYRIDLLSLKLFFASSNAEDLNGNQGLREISKVCIWEKTLPLLMILFFF